MLILEVLYDHIRSPNCIFMTYSITITITHILSLIYLVISCAPNIWLNICVTHRTVQNEQV